MDYIGRKRGLRTTFLALATPMIIIGLVALWVPSLYELDEPSPSDQGIRM